LFTFSRQVKMGEYDWNFEASNESSSLLEEESDSLISLPSRGTSEPGLSSRAQNMLLQKKRSFERYLPSTIFSLAGCGDDTAVSYLLTKDTNIVNTFDDTGNTLLHLNVALACRKGDLDDSFYKCIDLLMSCDQVKVNMPNKNGYTAIGLAVQRLHRKCIKHMLKHSSSHRLYFDCYPEDCESTVGEIIMETFPDLELPAPLKKRLDSTDRDKKVLDALQHDKYKIFSETLDPTNPNPWYDEPYHSSLLGIACQMKNRKHFV
jgi:ankyrin repeat protein